MKIANISELEKIQDHAIVITNNEGNIAQVNDKFLKVFGYLNDEIINEHVTIIIPPDLRDAHNTGFSRYQSSRESKILNQELELKAIKKNGEIFNAMHYIIAEEKAGSLVVGAVIKSI